MKKDLTNIHNNFFLQLLSKKQNAIDFLRISLPKEIFEQIDFDYLDFDKETHILPKLKSSMKDLVVKTKLKNKKEVDFYLLLEHKSTIDNDKPKDLFIQIFKYIFNITFEDYKNNKELRLVIPLVFYHGQKEWKIPSNFKDIFEVDESLKKHLIDFNYILFNTKDNPSIDKEIINNIHLYSGLIALKTIYDEEYKSLLEIIRLFYIYDKFKSMEELEIIIYYISLVKNIDKNKFENITKELFEKLEVEDPMVTFLDAIKTESKIEGEILDKQKTLIRQLSKKFGITENEKTIINNCSDAEKLDNALDEILFAENKFKVLDWLR
ncbi:MAG: hypothetical protein A2086_08385 [Spirochaetes bacterium GWD1_27_9]|nr:MAG: hypothetical protein A2Z98_13405 [Spirochaetes bacterium GWB1_27_13]OHD20916.1 MAG: hypothetical protein A2Y34_11825 [Spirochaetes bacterium GWC1_27_15]OHD39417.1 MAG: hypothetical protein A2086_08385 [Spirochaetes bacterium GWD1_27_9]